MLKHFLVMILSLAFLTAFGEERPVASIERIVGTVTFEGKPVKKGDVIDRPGVIETKEKSLVQFKVAKWNNVISIGPASKMTLNFSADKKYTLDDGVCRWKSAVGALKEAQAGKGKIFTRNVAMGVRGTDFLVKVTPLFGESEIIMFDGEVKMDNLEDATNSVIIKKGQWGGLGGRYGKKINPPLDLPESVLTSAQAAVEIE